MTTLRDNMVVVQFAANIPHEAQAKAMMAMEKQLRASTGLEVEVFKEAMADDSRLRNTMTMEQRDKL